MYVLASPEEVLWKLQSSFSGLTEEEVLKRRGECGFNELPVKERSLLLLFLSQFRDILVYILVAALVISIVLPFLIGGERTMESFLDAFVILAILLLNAGLGFAQEYKAEEAIKELGKLTAPRSTVRRAGKVSVIPSRELVPGDILILNEGDRISADGRLLSVSHLGVNESSLTGESQPIRKITEALSGNLQIAEQRNMVFAGTYLTRGSGEAVVTAISLQTEVGKIAKLVSETEAPETPLEQRLKALAKTLGIVVVGVCILVIAAGIAYGLPFTDILLIGVSLAVSAVPEGLPAIVTVCMAMGVRRMAKEKALVRRLESLEALGSVTVICADKTGTITENRMKVVETWCFDPSTPLRVTLNVPKCQGDNFKGENLLALIASSCNRAQLPDIGDPTEIGLLEFAKGRGVERLPIDEEEVPFTSEEKYMRTRHGNRSFLKGAPEKILEIVSRSAFNGTDEKCRRVMVSVDEPSRRQANVSSFVEACPELVPPCSFVSAQDDTGLSCRRAQDDTLAIFSSIHEKMLKKSEEMAKRGLRVLACALQDNSGVHFVGLIGMEDPPREGVKEAILNAHTAGIRTIMITGDHRETARAIAFEVGIRGDVLDGKDLDILSSEELCERLKTVAIFARVSPLHKVQILRGLECRGEVVAMSGDGVNDAPALKGAHVGIAMGMRGTDTAREASSIVLADDHYATIVAAVREGRRIYDNIRKFVLFLLRSNFDEILFILSAMMLGLPLPYLPIHILWINLMTDGLPALALGMEQPESNVMSRPPRSPSESVLSGQGWQLILAVLWGFAVSLFLYMWELHRGVPLEQARAAVLTLAISFELFLVFATRTQGSVFRVGLFSNRWLLWAVAIPFTLQFVLIFFPPARSLFHLAPLTLLEWVVVMLLSASGFFIFELIKVMVPTVRHGEPVESMT